MRVGPIPAGVGQRMALGQFQSLIVGIKEVARLAAHTQSEALADTDMAATCDLCSEHRAILESQIAIGRAAEAFDHQDLAL